VFEHPRRGYVGRNIVDLDHHVWIGCVTTAVSGQFKHPSLGDFAERIGILALGNALDQLGVECAIHQFHLIRWWRSTATDMSWDR
jgi:hypothetical protein